MDNNDNIRCPIFGQYRKYWTRFAKIFPCINLKAIQYYINIAQKFCTVAYGEIGLEFNMVIIAFRNERDKICLFNAQLKPLV